MFGYILVGHIHQCSIEGKLYWLTFCWAIVILTGTIRSICNYQELALTPNSKSYEMWRKPPMTLNFDIYLYNWTNPSNFTEGQFQKPILQQVGPFRFKEKPEKYNIRWHSKNSTVSYQKRSRYYFDEEGSKASLDDEITALNVIALVSSVWRRGFSLAESVRNVFVNVFFSSTVGSSKGNVLAIYAAEGRIDGPDNLRRKIAHCEAGARITLRRLSKRFDWHGTRYVIIRGKVAGYSIRSIRMVLSGERVRYHSIKFIWSNK